MEGKRSVKMEDPNPSSLFSDRYLVSGNYSLTGLEDFTIDGENGSLGFMELLGVQDYGPSVLDMLQVIPNQNQTSTVDQESSEVLNTPATPNFSSISSESSGGGGQNDEQAKEVVDEEDDEEEEEQKQKIKKQLKPNKTSQKRQREPRFAFMTKSEVDHLEDGYRWRKYGQKAVKNSPFPRSYYRCTNASCSVKKRIERSLNDPTIVMTTYEGQHTHPSPLMSRANTAAALIPCSGFSTGASTATFMPSPLQMSLSSVGADQVYCNYSTPLNFGFMGSTNINCAAIANQKRFCTPPSALITDYGLLQDIVPSTVRKEE
ncbi:probable WRKY transcription factor 23 [Olea europaea var. sylvestris]|uniref:WRKY transcription factor n=1 Tax=Olea europaea subsp. europaea TaxID=158383 RepID=A0A8S0T4Q8_OLEEU|nr:probable WRKY transcription factor 23 [Olea europaea var. sylvestris]CAA2999851.1 probable WRKY transcription factor 23 [Olea europaea subsp. europaea]